MERVDARKPGSQEPPVVVSGDALAERNTVAVSKDEPAEDKKERNPSAALRCQPTCVWDEWKLLTAVENQHAESGDEPESRKRVEFLHSWTSHLDIALEGVVDHGVRPSRSGMPSRRTAHRGSPVFDKMAFAICSPLCLPAALCPSRCERVEPVSH